MNESYLQNALIDVVIDTDTYNEIDDQFALAYMFCSTDKLNIKAIYAAPFSNDRASTPKEGVEKSFEEIKKLLKLLNRETFTEVYSGSENYLLNEKTPVFSSAAEHLARLAMQYSKENPLYVIAIATLTNIASALLINPEIADKIVLVWLGGNAWHCNIGREFNLTQDVAAARVAFEKCQSLVQVPCMGCVDSFCTTKQELTYYLKGKNRVCDYLLESVLYYQQEKDGYPWSKPIWDVAAVGYLLNVRQRFMLVREEFRPEITYDEQYILGKTNKKMTYVYHINRDELFFDLFQKISKL